MKNTKKEIKREKGRREEMRGDEEKFVDCPANKLPTVTLSPKTMTKVRMGSTKGKGGEERGEEGREGEGGEGS